MFFKSGILGLAMVTAFFMGVVKNASAFDGYVLYGGYGDTVTVLIDGNNDTLHSWSHTTLPDSLNGYSCYILPNGNLLRSSQTTKDPNSELSTGAAPKQGILSEINCDGSKKWEYELADKTNMLHHDCKVMPDKGDGLHLLAVSFVYMNDAQAIAAGLDESLFDDFMNSSAQLEKIIEVKIDTTGGGNHQIVWEWKIADHLIPKEQAAEHPEKFSNALGPLWAGQWVHLNGIDYCPDKDLILFTSRIFSEVYIIDHSTTTQQAATGSGGTHNKGGDILYRWGNSKNYGISGGKEIITLHCPTWIPQGYANAGNILFFHNNCENKNFNFLKKGMSEVIEITPPETFELQQNTAFGPTSHTWLYSPQGNDSIFSMSMSSAIRMKNGNTIVHEAYTGNIPVGMGAAPTGTSRLREVKPDGTVVGTPIMFGINAAKIMYYENDNVGITKLKEKTGKSSPKIERYRLNPIGTQPVILYNTANRSIDFNNISGAEIVLYSLCGEKIALVRPETLNYSFSTKALSLGTYVVKISNGQGSIVTRRINVL